VVAPVGLDVADQDEIIELLSDGEYPPARSGAIALNGFGYRWLRVRRAVRVA
jgi:hypothetical protein